MEITRRQFMQVLGVALGSVTLPKALPDPEYIYVGHPDQLPPIKNMIYHGQEEPYPANAGDIWVRFNSRRPEILHIYADGKWRVLEPTIHDSYDIEGDFEVIENWELLT